MSPKFQRSRIALAAGLAILAVAPAAASDASRWDGTQRAAVRLIAGAQRDGVHHAGLEIRLAPGWKTYWRYPGDSGIPPRFDFSNSRNVKSVTLRWPAPQRLTDEGGTSIGYKHDVVFPLDVVAQHAGEPVTLVLGIDYAVCERLCVPADGKAELTLTGTAGEHAQRIAQAQALVPRPAELGGGAFAIHAVKREGRKVLVDLTAPAGVELFAEGPAPDWALPVPAAVDGAPAGQQRFAFELDGLPPDTKPDGATLKLTAVAGEQAIEVSARLPAP